MADCQNVRVPRYNYTFSGDGSCGTDTAARGKIKGDSEKTGTDNRDCYKNPECGGVIYGVHGSDAECIFVCDGAADTAGIALYYQSDKKGEDGEKEILWQSGLYPGSLPDYGLDTQIGGFLW